MSTLSTAPVDLAARAMFKITPTLDERMMGAKKGSKKRREDKLLVVKISIIPISFDRDAVYAYERIPIFFLSLLKSIVSKFKKF